MLNIHSKKEKKGKYILNTGHVNTRHWYSAILTWIVV